jgi:broad specificity phosphatase PhoE
MIIFIRHGESQDNINPNIIDRDEVELTQTGINQAYDSGVFLRQHFDIKFIISSPLPRTIATTEEINKSINLPDKKIKTMKNLREQYNGILHGMTIDDIKGLSKISEPYKQIIDMSKTDRKLNFAKYMQLDSKFAKLIGGESWRQMQQRAKKVINYLKGLNVNGDVLVVSHHQFINAMISVITGMEKFAIGNNFVMKNGKVISNCHITVLEKNKIVVCKDTHHL